MPYTVSGLGNGGSKGGGGIDGEWIRSAQKGDGMSAAGSRVMTGDCKYRVIARLYKRWHDESDGDTEMERITRE